MNTKERNQEHEIDETARRLFQDFQVPPPSGTWENLDVASPDHEVDHIFQKHFSYLEVSPPERNWTAISKRIIFPPVILRHLSLISRVAAVLVIGLFLYQFLEKMPSREYATSSMAEVVSSKSITFGEAVQKNKELTKENLPILVTENHVATKERKAKKEAKMLLASLLTDDEFPDSLLDLESLEAILEPLKPLPVFSAMASAAENEKIIVDMLSIEKVKSLPKLPTIDLQISIPLRVVEEHEIEHLLKMYDVFEKEKAKEMVQ